jgi:hypothetical protein
MNRNDDTPAKPCFALVDALQSVVPLKQQYCTPGHRSGKAFAMLIEALSYKVDDPNDSDEEVKNDN